MSTVLFLHAHPDDEALFTGGTMAKLAANGHRVVLVTATDGAAGLVSESFSPPENVAAVRRNELAASSRALGVSASYNLGFADSGLDGRARVQGVRFADTDVTSVAQRVHQIARAERAQVVVGYDKFGGYGHPDHVQVHHVVRSVVDRGTGLVGLEATLPREPLLRVIKLVRSFRWLVPSLAGLDVATWARAFTARRDIAYRVDVSDELEEKRAALRAHASQASGDDGPRTIAALLALPRPVFRRLLGEEFYTFVPFSPRVAMPTLGLSKIFVRRLDMTRRAGSRV